jgi:hypothetical protein
MTPNTRLLLEQALAARTRWPETTGVPSDVVAAHV